MLKLPNKLQNQAHKRLNTHLTSHIYRLLGAYNEKIKILDLGAGAGKIWNQIPISEKDRQRVSITLLDATPIPTEGENTRILGLIPRDLKKIHSNTYHFVIALDVIEHLTNSDGYLMIYEMERIASDSIFIYTPNGFVWQPPSPNNIFNAHISGWIARDFRKMNFDRINGAVGFKSNYFTYSQQKSHGKILENFHAVLDFISVVFFPRTCYSLIAFKKTSNFNALKQEL